MALAYDDEELTISLSSTQLRRNSRRPAAEGQSHHNDNNNNNYNHNDKNNHSNNCNDDVNPPRDDTRHEQLLQQHHLHDQQKNQHNDQQPPAQEGSIAAAMGPTVHPNGPVRDTMRTEHRIGAYNVVKTLGEGSFGKVKLAVHRSTGQQVALKIISRKNLISRDMQGRVEREIEYLQLLRHPHIIKL